MAAWSDDLCDLNRQAVREIHRSAILISLDVVDCATQGLWHQWHLLDQARTGVASYSPSPCSSRLAWTLERGGLYEFGLP